MHKTLKAEATRPAADVSLPNSVSSTASEPNSMKNAPQKALDQNTQLPSMNPRHVICLQNFPHLNTPIASKIRYVSANGGIRWNSDWVNVSTVCAGEYVGLEEIDDGIWNVYFGPLKLGRLHERHMRIEDEYGRLNVSKCNPCPQTILSPISPAAHTPSCTRPDSRKGQSPHLR